MPSVISTSEIAARIEVERSFRTLIVIAPGIEASSLGSAALTASTTATVLALGWRWMARMIERPPSYQPAVWVFWTESMTLATSERRTGLPFGSAITNWRNSAALVICVGASMTSAWLLFCSVPTGVWLLASESALASWSRPIERVASLSGSTCTRTA